MTDKYKADEQNESEKTIDETETVNQEIDDSKLTPWQKENLKYLNETGKKPKWLEKPESDQVEKLTFSKKNLLDDDDDEDLEEDKIVSFEGSEKSKKVEEDKAGNPLDLPKSLSYADKLPKIKEARRKRLIKRLTVLLSVFVLATAGLIYYISPYSKLGGIDITGNKVVSKQAIANATQLKKGQFFWNAYFDKQVAENILSKLPRIKSIKKEIVNINQLKFTVSEYTESAYAKKDGKYFPILESGYILDEAVERSNEEFTMFTNFKNDKQFTKMFDMYQNLAANIQQNISEIILNPDGNIKSRVFLRMKDGNQVVGSTKDLAQKIGYYDKIAEKMEEKGIVDMEAGIYSYSYATKEAQDLQRIAETSKEENEDKKAAANTGDSESTVDENSLTDPPQDMQENQEDPSDSEVIDELKNNE